MEGSGFVISAVNSDDLKPPYILILFQFLTSNLDYPLDKFLPSRFLPWYNLREREVFCLNKRFVPPAPHIENGEDIIASLDGSKLSGSSENEKVRQYVARYRDREKISKCAARRKWFADNWIALLSLLFAFIAALPVINQGNGTLLKWITLLSSAAQQLPA